MRNLFIFFLFSLFFVPNAWADNDLISNKNSHDIKEESVSLTGVSDQQFLNETLLVSGKVKSIEFDKKTVVVKPKKGKKIHVTYGHQTEFMGFVTLEEFEKRQRIKIWYFKDGEKNMAVKIQMVPELGC